MSWFNLNVNDSLNTLKGQISNVSNAVHDVFTEGILDETNANVETETITSEVTDVEMLEAANRKIEELSTLCTSQDNEVKLMQKKKNIRFKSIHF